MQGYYPQDLGLEEENITDYGKSVRAKVYLASEADARIAELEKALREVRDYALYRHNHSGIAREILKMISPLMER